MKRVMSIFTVAAVLLVLGAGMASAVTKNGDNRDDNLRGTNTADTLRGNGGEDDLFGLGGNDTLLGGADDDDLIGGNGADRLTGGVGEDEYEGGNGNDNINAVDRSEDDIECGAGVDTVKANPGDDVSRDCERVTRSGADVDRFDDRETSRQQPRAGGSGRSGKPGLSFRLSCGDEPDKDSPLRPR